MSRITVLTSVPTGTRAKVISIGSGRGRLRRLIEMGLLPGEVIEVVSNSVGPVIIKVRNTMIAIGRGMASSIMVEVLDDG